MSEEHLLEGEEQPHLLLVDDDPTFTRVMARAMDRRGLRVSVANSAEEGLAIAKAAATVSRIARSRSAGVGGWLRMTCSPLPRETSLPSLASYRSICRVATW